MKNEERRDETPAPTPADGAETPESLHAEAAPDGGDGPRDEALEQQVVGVLRTVFDPEIPVNIHELGLIYDLTVSQDGHARIVMTLTSPNCPVAESLPNEVKQKVGALEGIHHVDLDLTWEPPWGPDKMSEAAKLTLGMV